jgi:hypothetical protein
MTRCYNSTTKVSKVCTTPDNHCCLTTDGARGCGAAGTDIGKCSAPDPV